MFTHQLCNFNLILGSPTSKRCVFFPRCWWNQRTQVPFATIIQTPIQWESMLSFGHNGAIYIDATFGTKDMKFHLFTLMGFDDHCIGVLLTWIIISRQTVEDLIEWLKPLKKIILSHMPHWKPSCFLINDAP